MVLSAEEENKNYTFDASFMHALKKAVRLKGRQITMSHTATDFICKKFSEKTVSGNEIAAAIKEFVTPNITYKIGEEPRPKELIPSEVKDFENLSEFLLKMCEEASRQLNAAQGR